MFFKYNPGPHYSYVIVSFHDISNSFAVKFPSCSVRRPECSEIYLIFLQTSSCGKRIWKIMFYVSETNTVLTSHQYYRSIAKYFTLTHIKIVRGKVSIINRRDIRTNSQPKHPSLPEDLSVESKEHVVSCTGIWRVTLNWQHFWLSHFCETEYRLAETDKPLFTQLTF